VGDERGLDAEAEQQELDVFEQAEGLGA